MVHASPIGSSEALGSAPESAIEADLGGDAALVRIAELATLIFEVPYAAIVTTDGGRLQARAQVGPAPCGLDFAAAGEGLVVLVGAKDAADLPAGLGFLAQAPLIAKNGAVIGMLRLADKRSRPDPSEAQRRALASLAQMAVGELAREADEAERETLVAELDHRVKNVLAAVQSLAAQSARRASSLEGFLKTFAGRLKSMASAHQLLTATRWRGAGMQNIAAAELGGLAPGQTHWEGPDILLTPRAANAMSLALHELATNAVKFGALSTDLGRVEVSWRLDGERLSLVWTESGGPAVKAPQRRGFGSTLLEKVTGRELGGGATVDFRREGVRATLTVGADALAAPSGRGPEAAAPTPSPNLAGASQGQPEQAARVAGLRVLIVEDALLLALELAEGLTEAGATIVGSAADVGEALRMAELPMDAAVLDANLNGASVMPVAEALAARGVPFVFATGYGDTKFAPAEFDAPLIKKPYDVTQVAAALAEITVGRPVA